MIDIIECSLLKMNGFVYRPRRQSHRDAHIVIKSQPCGHDCTCPRHADGSSLCAAELLNVLLSRRNAPGPSQQSDATGSVFLVVRRRHCLKQSDLHSDPYRQFTFSVSGCLYSKHFRKPEVIMSQSVLCPYAATPYREPPSQQYGTWVHVLPLSRVSTYTLST